MSKNDGLGIAGRVQQNTSLFQSHTGQPYIALTNLIFPDNEPIVIESSPFRILTVQTRVSRTSDEGLLSIEGLIAGDRSYTSVPGFPRKEIEARHALPEHYDTVQNILQMYVDQVEQKLGISRGSWGD